ncbi:MAG: ImpA family metalloprotease [Gammaproteobacteria bacterium]
MTSGAFDILIVALDDDIAIANSAIAQGKPVIVVNHWYGSYRVQLEAFELTRRSRGGNLLGDFPNSDAICDASLDASQVLTMFGNLHAESLAFNYTAEACPNNVGKVTCESDLLMDSSGATLNQQFLNGATVIRDQLQAFDATGTNIFDLGNDQRLLKLAVLLGDKLREDITYPMDKETTPDPVFYNAYFADHAVHYSRPNNVFQPDGGNYSSTPATLNAKPSAAATYTATPTIYTEWTSTGFYAPPGATVTVRRTDASSNQVKMRFGMLRNTVRVWNPDEYGGPKFQTSHTLTLQPNVDYRLSTPYGGPVYIWSRGVASGALPFTVEFDGILRHPLLTDFSAASIQQYLSELEAGMFDWTDIKTPFVEIHSLTRHMLRAFARYDGDEANGYTVADVQGFMSDMNNYLIINNLSWAGFVGPSLTPINANVSAFCTARGLDCTDPVIHLKPKVQHINSENRAACGDLCSGNPFDSGSPLAPLGWGESHELGHNLQRGRLQIYGGRSGETSNNIFPVHVNTDWTRDQGLTEHPKTRSSKHDVAFAILQDAIANAVAPNINHPLWQDPGGYANASPRLSFFIQLAYANASWDIYTLMYLMERIFTDAIKTDAKWTAAGGNLGFGNYTRAEARNINGNDFMYVAVSLITDMDHADYFEAWGIEISAEAKAQVQANGSAGMAPAVMYYVEGNKIFADFPNTPANVRPLDGVTAWEPAAPALAALSQQINNGTRRLALSDSETQRAVVSTSTGLLGFASLSANLQNPTPPSTTLTALTPPTASASPPGGIYPLSVEVTLTCTDPDNDCQSIFYTLDDSVPTTDSILYTGPFTLTERAFVNFIAVDSAGETSPVATEGYDISPPTEPLVFASPPAGEFDADVEVTLTCDDIENNCNTIFYTLDGSEPTTGSLVYNGPLTIERTTTLSYFGMDTDGNRSPVVIGEYDIQVAPALPIASASPPGGSFEGSVQITLNCVDPDNDCLSLFYTLDGTQPTTGSTLFTEPFTLQQNTTLRILALDESGNLSADVTEVYEFPAAPPSAPTASASPAGGDFDAPVQVTLSCTDPDNDCQSIFYTLDGSDPTSASIEFTGPFVLQEDTTLRFIAIDTAGNVSPVVSETYTISAVATPAPGGVIENLQLWLRADVGTDAALDGDAVASWLDQSSKANNAVSAGATGTEPSLELEEFNFNPVIRYGLDGNRYLRSPVNPVTDDLSLIAVFRTFQTAGSSVFWNAPALISGENPGAADWALGLNGRQVHLKAEFGDGVGLGSGRDDADGITHIAIGTRMLGGTTALHIDGDTVASGVSDSVSLNTSLGVGIGNHATPTPSGKFDGDLAEAIIYSAVLGDEQRQRVESYLAIKYGVTLDQAIPRNYVDSAGNVVYDVTLAAGFITDVAGIGADSGSLLNQPRSKSSNDGALVTIASTGDLQNGEFVMWGNNGGAIDVTIDIVVANSTLRRIERTWYVDRTGDTATIDMEIDSADIPALAAIGILENYRLLIADDPAFTNPQIIDLGNVPGPITVPAVDIGDNQYFTFAIE